MPFLSHRSLLKDVSSVAHGRAMSGEHVWESEVRDTKPYPFFSITSTSRLTTPRRRQDALGVEERPRKRGDDRLIRLIRHVVQAKSSHGQKVSSVAHIKSHGISDRLRLKLPGWQVTVLASVAAAGGRGKRREEVELSGSDNFTGRGLEVVLESGGCLI